MKIYIGADQGGVDLKDFVLKHLQDTGRDVVDLGINDHNSIDYPDKAHEVARHVIGDGEENACGIIICGTGIGVSMAANKVPGIRAALCADCFSARMAREHNNANIITMGGRTTGPELAVAIVESYLNAEFAGGRHARRVGKIDQVD